MKTLLSVALLALPVYAQTAPPVHPPGLATAKQKLAAGDAALQPALDRLTRDADKALRAGPFTVTAKHRTPPSGDKHDYLSLAPYYWPNPNTKDGLPYVNRDGEVNPESKQDTDSPALGSMASAVQTLCLAWYFTGKADYAAHAELLLRTWFLDAATRMNPNLNFAQGIPGRDTGRPTGIIDTHVLVGLWDAVNLLQGAAGWSDEDRNGLREWARHYLTWLRDSKNGRGEAKTTNNHGTWYDAQVCALALFTGQDHIARSVAEAAKEKRLAKQIEPDGKMPRELARTKSLGYTEFNLRALFELAAMGQRAGVDLWHFQTADGRSIRAALDFAAPHVDPAHPWPFRDLKPDPKGLVPLLIEAQSVYGVDPYAKWLATVSAEDVAAQRARLFWPR
jgi:hypothetical protein